MGDDAPQMSSQRPYLLRALYEWVVDNGMTPHVLVDATRPGVSVPPSTVLASEEKKSKSSNCIVTPRCLHRIAVILA